MKSKYISPHHVLTVHYVKLLYFIYISIYLIITIIYLFFTNKRPVSVCQTKKCYHFLLYYWLHQLCIIYG